jgi:dihydrofolate reductase
MRKIYVIDHLTLDGVMQAPGRPDEDTRGGFGHGGWAAARQDQVMAERLGQGLSAGGPLLLGRRTYEGFASFWPRQADNPYTEALNRAEKYVVSTTLTEPLPWQNSTLLDGDAAESVAELKSKPGADICVMGSGVLVRTLLRHGLVDELLLMIHPIVLGTGRRLFDDSIGPIPLELADSVTTTKGVFLATYRPEGGASR